MNHEDIVENVTADRSLYSEILSDIAPLSDMGGITAEDY
jgi:hypothetical protein